MHYMVTCEPEALLTEKKTHEKLSVDWQSLWIVDWKFQQTAVDISLAELESIESRWCNLCLKCGFGFRLR